MPFLNRPFSGKPVPYAHYIDLECWQDDQTVLRNPHKGWYWHYIDNGYGREDYRKEIAPGDYMKDFPGLNHLYLRFDWGDIEKEEGKYDWSYIDSIMDEWGAQGYRFSFRVCTYEGDGRTESLRYATPKWVYEAGAQSVALPDGRLEPVYGDPVYLEKLEQFMRAYGEKFNHDPRVEFIDIGTFGTWGEGHTYMGSDTVYSNHVIKKHIALHAKYFPDKFVLLNDDLVGHRASVSEEAKMDLVEFAKTLGCGARDDSICVASCCGAYGYDTIRSPHFFDHLRAQAPVDLEFEHYTCVLSDPGRYRDGYPFIEALRRTHATYAGFHGYPRPWLERYPYITEYLANRLGYWYFIDGLRLTDWVEGCDSHFSVRFVNRGFSHAYNRFALKVKLIHIETGVPSVFDTDIDNRRWMEDSLTEESITLHTRNLPAGRYQIWIGLFEGARSIAFAMAPERQENGWVYLADANIAAM